MKRKILVPMFASAMVLSMNVANAEEEINKEVKQDNTQEKSALELEEYENLTYKKAKVKEGSAVKIRKDGDVQHIAYEGAELKVLGQQGEWFEVQVDEETKGWVPARFVELDSAKGYVQVDKLNLRVEANTEAEIQEELTLATSMKVLADNGDWAKVEIDGTEGYVKSNYISDEKPVIEVVEENVAETVVSSSNNTQQNNNEQTSSPQENNNSSNANNNTQTNRPQENNNSNNTNNNTQTSKPEQNNNGSEVSKPSNGSKASAVVNLAYSKLGSPYVWGAEGPSSFDCSGLTYYVYKNAAGVSLPRSTSGQIGVGSTVSKSNLQPGDLVFFTTNGTGSVSHVGIYVGGGNMIHSPKPGKTVEVTSIHSSYWSNAYLTAKRVL